MPELSRNEIRARYHQANAGLNFSLEVFGDELAKREGYKDVDGFEAIHLYLATKYCWRPAEARALSYDDMRFMLDKEMQGWTLPVDARHIKFFE